MRYLFSIIIIFIIGVLASCIKNPVHIDPFPIKANPDKFECYINGQDFVPDSGRLQWTGGPVTIYVRPQINAVYKITIEAHISGYGVRGDREVILQIQNVSGTGVYQFDDPANQYANYTAYPVINSTTVTQQIPPDSYSAPASGKGSLTLTRFDLENHVIAGTFSFGAANKNNSADSVKVTGGHFNIVYNQ